MTKFIDLHGRDNTPALFNINSIHSVYFDEEENSTAIDYGSKETFFIRESVEEVRKLLYDFIHY